MFAQDVDEEIEAFRLKLEQAPRLQVLPVSSVILPDMYARGMTGAPSPKDYSQSGHTLSLTNSVLVLTQ